MKNRSISTRSTSVSTNRNSTPTENEHNSKPKFALLRFSIEEKKNQKWQPQQMKKTQTVETKMIPSKTETTLKRISSTNQMCKLKRFFHRKPAELFNFHRHAPTPLPFLFSLLKNKEKLEIELEGEGFFSIVGDFSIVCCVLYVCGGLMELIGWREKE